MAVKSKSFTVLSSDGTHKLAGIVYSPEGKVKGFFHVVHGMTEHMERYYGLLETLAENGWVSFGYDHPGHGKTALNDEELGYIAAKDGWDILAKDVKTFAHGVMAEYASEEGKLPYVLMGHSMGSFIVRVAAEKYVTPTKLIVMGTSGENKAAGAGLALVGLLKKLKGEKHISPLLENIAFGSYNKRFGGGTKDDPKPWLTTDGEVRKKYYADKFCMFKFTVSAMGDLIRLIKECNRPDWFKNIPKTLPIYLVSGSDDPVGNYGKGVTEVYSRLKNAGCDVKYKLYEGARHEILNDFTREECIKDIIAFAEPVTRG